MKIALLSNYKQNGSRTFVVFETVDKWVEMGETASTIFNLNNCDLKSYNCTSKELKANYEYLKEIHEFTGWFEYAKKQNNLTNKEG